MTAQWRSVVVGFLVLTFVACGGHTTSSSNPAPPTLASISVAPAAHSIQTGATRQFTATGSFTDGSTKDLTSTATWSSSNTVVATISAAGLATGAGAGTTTITAVSGSISGTTTLTVTASAPPPTLVSISVTPPAPALQIGSTLQFTATGSFSDNTTQNLTSTAAWSSSNNTVASITATGLVMAGAAGTTTIKAASGSISGSTTLTVSSAAPPTLVSMAVTPAAPSSQINGTVQFTATGSFSDNSTQNLTSTATWSSSNPAIAAITAAGFATGVGAGTSTIAAASGSVSGSTTLTVGGPVPAATDVLTYHNDNARTGQDLHETILTPSNVNATTFGKLFVIPVDGKVDAQPLYVSNVPIPGNGTHNVLVVASEHDSVYAFDADTGAKLWQVSMLKTGETTSEPRFGCGQVSPEIGVTATLVIDRNAGPNGTIYVVAMSKNSTPTYFQRIHALNLATGAEQFSGPKDVQASFPGTGDNSNGTSVIFDPGAYKERPGLLLLNGVVYTSWSSHCDIEPYTGWIMGYDQNTLSQVNVLDITPNGSEASFWNSGAGLAADSSGNIYQEAANGTFDSTLNANGFPSKGDFGNAFVKISTSGNQLAVADYFALFNTASESSSDTDLGSGGAMLLPDLTDGSGNIRHLSVAAGKDGNIYVVERDNMGKFNASTNNIYQQLTGAIGSEFGIPAYFNNTVFYGGAGDTLKAFSIANAKLGATPASQSATSFGYPGASPSISANGTSNGIVWAAENTNPAVLHAYDATNLAKELYNSNQAASGRDHFGAGNKFIVPTVANGKVYAGTTNGVGVFGLLP